AMNGAGSWPPIWAWSGGARTATAPPGGASAAALRPIGASCWACACGTEALGRPPNVPARVQPGHRDFSAPALLGRRGCAARRGAALQAGAGLRLRVVVADTGQGAGGAAVRADVHDPALTEQAA